MPVAQYLPQIRAKIGFRVDSAFIGNKAESACYCSLSYRIDFTPDYSESQMPCMVLLWNLDVRLHVDGMKIAYRAIFNKCIFPCFLGKLYPICRYGVTMYEGYAQ